jgi:hypothetical protein
MPISNHQPFDPWLRFWEDDRGPKSGDEFSVLAAMIIGVSAREAVEDLHANGAFSEQQAPALNRRLRNRAYEVLLAVQALVETGHHDQLTEFLAVQATLDGEATERIKPIAALRGAIRAAVHDFAGAERLDSAIAKKLESAAVGGATDAFKALRSLDKLESAQEVSYMARLIPPYWEFPEVAPELREMFGMVPSHA